MLICRTLCLFFIIASLVLYFTLKDKTYLSHIFLLIGIILFADAESGGLLGYFYYDKNEIGYILRIFGNHIFVFSIYYFYKGILSQKGKKIAYDFIIINTFLVIQEVLMLVYEPYRLHWGGIIVFTMLISYYISMKIFFIFVKAYKEKHFLCIQSILNFLAIISLAFIFITAPHIGLTKRSIFSPFFIYVAGVLGSLFIYYLLGLKYQKTFAENQRLIEQEKQFQKEYLEAIIQSQEQERIKIKTEIENKISNDLGYINNVIQQSEPHLQEVVQDTINKVSLINQSLEKDIEKDTDLMLNLNELALQFTSQHIHFKCMSTSNIVAVKNEYKQHIYLIIQELFVNATKHSKAKHVFLSIEKENETLQITYSDDGCGLPKKRVKSGIGMKNIQQRVNLMIGKIEIINCAGLTIKINIPNE